MRGGGEIHQERQGCRAVAGKFILICREKAETKDLQGLKREAEPKAQFRAGYRGSSGPEDIFRIESYFNSYSLITSRLCESICRYDK